jgi:hypothetical protein
MCIVVSGINHSKILSLKLVLWLDISVALFKAVLLHFREAELDSKHISNLVTHVSF